MRAKCKALFGRNPGLKLIALVIGFLIWLFVTNSNDPIRTSLIANVPITIINENAVADIGKVVQPEGSGTVTLRITERKSVLQKLARSGADFYVEADLENMTNLNTVPLTVSSSFSAITWDEIEMSPAVLKVTLEDKVEQAFPVTVTSTGNAATGYTIGSTDVEEGKTLLLAGPSSLINIIDRVSAPINVTGISSDVTVRSNLKIFDKNGSELTDSQMALLEIKTADGSVLSDRNVLIYVEMWEVRSDLRLKVTTSGTPASGYSVSGIKTIPETISLAGTKEALDKIGRTLEAVDPVSVQDADQEIETELDLSTTIDNYEDIRLISDADETVTVVVSFEKRGDISLEIPLSQIQAENTPQDMKLVFTPADKITLSMHGDGTETEIPTAENITAMIDLSECREEGTYEIPVQVTLPDGYELSDEISLKVSATSIAADDISVRDVSDQNEQIGEAETDMS